MSPRPAASTARAALSSLAAALCAVLARASADCGQCSTYTCVGGGFLPERCACLPSGDNCPAETTLNATSSAADKAGACIATVSGCALDDLKQYLPGLDTRLCETDAAKRALGEGGWQAYYGPRRWDSEPASALVGLFFPLTPARASARLVRGAPCLLQGFFSYARAPRSAPAIRRWTSSRGKATAWSQPCAARCKTRRTRCSRPPPLSCPAAAWPALRDARDAPCPREQVYWQVETMFTKLFDGLLSGGAARPSPAGAALRLQAARAARPCM